MEKGKYLKLQNTKQAKGHYVKGTFHWLFICITGFLGIVYFTIWIIPVINRQITLNPTTISIEQIETHGFPKKDYLTITDGHFVFSEAGIVERNRNADTSYLAVPIVSRTLQKKWQQSIQNHQPIDASSFRLFVIFTGKQTQQFWPENASLQDMQDSWQHKSKTIAITGETGKSRDAVIRKPMDSPVAKKNLNWDDVYYLKLNKHTYSLKRSVKHFSYAFILLSLSILTLRYHLRTCKGDVPGCNIGPFYTGDIFDDSSDGDIDGL